MIRLRTDERGVSLVDLLVGMLITSFVLAGVATTLVSAQRTEIFSDRDSQALAALRHGVQRLTTELRQARKIYPDSTTSRMRFWVDEDRDNQQDLAERIVWEVENTGSTATLTRSTDATSTELPVVSLIVPGTPFEYEPGDPSSTLVTLVRITLVADTDTDEDPESRTVRTEVRIRNAPR